MKTIHKYNEERTHSQPNLQKKQKEKCLIF
jgi:hypothetical protein